MFSFFLCFLLIVPQHGESAIHIAAACGNINILEFLVSRGARVDATDKHGANAVYFAARQGHVEAIRFLKERNCPLDGQDKSRETPMHVAARYDVLDVVEYLCQAGAKPNLQDQEMETALHCAAWHGHIIVSQVLCRAGWNPNLQNRGGETALLNAAARGYREIVHDLLESGAQLKIVDKNGSTALHHCIRSCHYDIAHHLISRASCWADLGDRHGETPMHLACQDGRLPIVQALCRAGYRLDPQNKKGCTPLHLAALHGHAEVVRQLCLAGANVDALTNVGDSPEQLALTEQQHEVVQVLSRLRKDGQRTHFAAQLRPSNAPLSRVKLKILGFSGSGKSALVESLKCGLLRGLFFRPRLCRPRLLSLAQPTSSSPTRCGNANAGNNALSASITNLYPGCENVSVRSRSMMFEPIIKKGSRNFLVSPSKSTSFTFDEQSTRAIDVQNTNISGAGEFSIWEFSGNPVYFCSYDLFLADDTTAIHFVLFSLEVTFEIQLNHLIFWLNSLKALRPIEEPFAYASQPNKPLRVVLVATHADIVNCPRGHSGEFVYRAGAQLLRKVKHRFGTDLDISDRIFVLDATAAQSKDVKLLRSHLLEVRTKIITEEKCVSSLCECMLAALPSWRKACGSVQLISWEHFAADMRNMNPLANAEQVDIVANQLHCMGEVHVFHSDTVQHLVLMDPRWFGSCVLGRLLSADRLRGLSRYRGRFAPDELQAALCEGLAETDELLQLLEAMGVCARDASPHPPTDSTDGTPSPEPPGIVMVTIPALIQETKMSQHRWEEEREGSVYGGVRIVPAEHPMPFPVGFFHKLQAVLSRFFFQPMSGTNGSETDVDLRLWVGGARVASRGAEAFVLNVASVHAIEVKVHGPQFNRAICLELLEFLCGTVETLAAGVMPGLAMSRHYLSPQQLKEQVEPLMAYQPRDFQRARLQNDGRLSNTFGEYYEDFASVLCFGCPKLYVHGTFGLDLHISELSLHARRRLARLLDPPDATGKDCCLLAMRLGLHDLLPGLQTTGRVQTCSPTDGTIIQWGKLEGHAADAPKTIGVLVNKLRDLGRRDAADMIVRLTPIFKINMEELGTGQYSPAQASSHTETSCNSLYSALSR
uniref:death-associated protein kinase 1-like n=1 Tax=Myxine glutinosa TaxID=7769 RepID=UPI00358FCEC6